jgi:hypothetical protein
MPARLALNIFPVRIAAASAHKTLGGAQDQADEMKGAGHTVL